MAGARASALPQNARALQRDRDTGTLRKYSRRVIGRRTRSGNGCLVEAAAKRVRQRSQPSHLFPYRVAAVDCIRIQLNTHGLGFKAIEKDFDFNDVLMRVRANPELSEGQRVPLLIHGLPPIDDLPARCAFSCRTLTIGGGCRKVVSLSVFAHCAVGGESRRSLRHALPHPPDPRSRDPLIVPSIKLWDHLPLQQIVLARRLRARPRGIRRHAPGHPPRPNRRPVHRPRPTNHPVPIG